MRDGLVAKDELEEILRQQQDTRQQRISGRRLGEILIRRGVVTPTQVAKLVAEQYELPFMELDVSGVDRRVAAVLSEDAARRFSAVPISRRGDGTYLLAIADPATVLFSDELRKLLGSLPSFAVVGPDAIERAIELVHGNPMDVESEVAAPADEPDRDAVLLSFPASGGSTFDGLEAEISHSPLKDAWPPLGALLVREGLLTEGDLDAALAQQRLAPSLRLGEILVGKGVVSPAVVARLVAEQYELPFAELETLHVDHSVARRLPEEIARRLTAAPLASLDDGSLQVAIADPTSAVYSDELQQALDTRLEFVVASPDEIRALLDRVHEPEGLEELAAAPEPLSADLESFTPFSFVETDTPEPPTAPQLEVEPVHVDLAPAEDPSWASRLELVDEVAAAEGHEAEPTPAELAWHGEDESVETTIEEAADAIPDAAVPDSMALLEPFIFELASPGTADGETAEPAAPEEPEAVEESAFELTWPALRGAHGRRDEHETTDEPAELSTDTADSDDADAAEAEAGEDAELPPLAHFTIHPEASADEDEPAEQAEVIEPDEPELEAAAVEIPEPEALAVDGLDLDSTVEAALVAGASTLHFSPLGDELAVRARVDGLVRELGAATPAERDALVERLEAEGAVRTHVVSTSRGEKTTVFVRRRAGSPTTLEELGLDAEAAERLRAALEQPAGAILSCGPAGSGTTTTLYAALEAFAAPGRVATTVEHPVERFLDGVDQIEVDPANGVTFATALRELRFTDPDAVLVGDLADLETAELALQAAYEGRLVLAAFHAPSAAAAVVRLADMGVETALLGSSLGCVVAQRLVRCVCADCRETYYASDEELALLGQTESTSPRLLARGRGCASCDGSGFRGRIGFFEVMHVTDEIRELVADGASAKKIQKAAVSAGMRTLRDDGVRLCLDGVTTPTEVARILRADA